MRIVIDFLDSQRDADPAALALALQLAASAGSRELWMAVPLCAPRAIDTVRMAFAGVLPRERVRAFDTGGGGEGALAGLLRQQALASLDPDLVLAPGRAGAAHDASAPFPVLAVDPQRASADSLWSEIDASAAQRRPAPAPVARPRLAYVSPLPPERSGIADYSAELVPELVKFYEVELIVAQERVDDRRLDGLPQHDLAWFREHAREFDRLLYQFGNSQAHQHMFELVREHPGTVELHDFYLSGVLDNLEREGYLEHGFVHALYESHGYTGLLEHRKQGRHPSIWKYPLNRGVLDHADGVIIHSDFCRQLAERWYGPGAASGWRTIPLMRGRPDGSTVAQARSAARRRLELGPDDYLVCSFGMLGRTKLNEELLDAWLSSPLADDPHCRLVFVGAMEPGTSGAALMRRIAAAGAGGGIRVTGFTQAATYADYLAACDCAVQLRRDTRGETSAAVLDCLLYGVPVVVNAHGANADYDEALLVKLADRFTRSELAAALARVRDDAALRERLSHNALAHMAAAHAPAHVGRLYRDVIEHFAQQGEQARYRALVAAAAPLCAESDLQSLARAIAFNRAPRAPRQLLVDVSALVEADLRTGIQRVVRSVLLALIKDPPPGFRVEPVFSYGGNRSYQYARRFGMGMIGETALALEEAPVELRPGDIFLGLDLFTNGTAQNQGLLHAMRARGAGIYFVVFDLLPVLRPEVFPFGAAQYFADFLRTVHAVSDGVLCISRAVADELAAWIAAQGLRRRTPLHIGHFHLGADIGASAPSVGLPPQAGAVLAALAARPSFLMVGTVEPRKGHAQALAAFELLWARGVDVNLVVVGKEGWMVEQLTARMASHPDKGQRLFWLAGISDEMLLALYAGAAALLQPSEGEGFGLPLIEAAQHGVPIIARDLPVFREVAGDHAWYFSGLAPHDLARALDDWLALRRDGKAPASTGMPWLTWDQSARQVLDAILGQRWDRVLPGTEETHDA